MFCPLVDIHEIAGGEGSFVSGILTGNQIGILGNLLGSHYSGTI
jgi:hypothetical protein